MAIEFRCPNCEKKLKTGEDKAGKTAKCPQCGTPVTVPATSLAEDEFEGFPSFGELEAPPAAAPLPRRRTAESGQVACPMCGAMNDPSADRCYACGEDLAWQPGATPAAPRPGRGQVDIGQALSDGWAVFRDQLGGMLAICVVTFFAVIAASIPFYVLMFGGIAAVMAAAGPNGQPNMILFGFVQLVSTLLLQLVIWFFSIGFTRAMLLLVRQKELSVGAIFSGGRYYGLMALNSLVVFLITQGPSQVGAVLQNAAVEVDAPALMFVGLGLSLISLILTAVVWPCIWPYTYIIVDERAGTLSGLDPLRKAWRITPGSRLASFALFLLLGVINMLGVFALCVGVIFTATYMMGTLTVAYEQISPRLRRA